MMGIKQRYNRFPIDPARWPFFYGWVIVLFGTLGVIMSAPGQTTGVSTFTDYLIDAFGLTRTQLSTAYLIGTLGSSLFIARVGRLYDQLGSRWMGILTTWVMGLALLFLSQSDRLAFGFTRQFGLESAQLSVSILVLVIGFFVLRLSGQGALTMLSRNMIMKWFISRRGLAGGISSVFVSLGFSVAPLLYDQLIETSSWRIAWVIIAAVAGFGFSILVFLFFRDNPEDCGLEPDGKMKKGVALENVMVRALHQFTPTEARKTFTLWAFTVPLALHALAVTGFIFNVVSIFDEAGMDKMTALSIFVPSSLVAVGVTLASGYLSDFVKLKKLLIVMILGQMLSLLSLANLSSGPFYYLLFIGDGIANGLYAVLIGVAWPRFFGRKYLGEISGLSMSVVMFFSALGPLLYSLSFTQLGSYAPAAWLVFILCVVCGFAALRADNPQEKRKADPN